MQPSPEIPDEPILATLGDDGVLRLAGESDDLGAAILAELQTANRFAAIAERDRVALVDELRKLSKLFEKFEPLLDQVAARMSRRRRGGWNPGGE